jgi:hypothetical protein
VILLKRGLPHTARPLLEEARDIASSPALTAWLEKIDPLLERVTRLTADGSA